MRHARDVEALDRFLAAQPREFGVRIADVAGHRVVESPWSPRSSKSCSIVFLHYWAGVTEPGRATDFTSVYCRKPSTPFWRPTPLAL